MSSQSIASVVARLSPVGLRTSSIPRFTASNSAVETGWADYASSQSAIDLPTYLGSAVSGKDAIIFGEQHHQPGVLKAQLQLIHILASPPINARVTILMEHFNLLQQPLLRSFAATGDAEALQTEYAKAKEGFRLTMAGYLPLLLLAREMGNVNSEIVAGFPPREWARIVMKEGRAGIEQDDQITSSGVLKGFDRWQDLDISKEHNAYIRSSMTGNRPSMEEEVKQGGLNAAQAFKDSVMAWKADQLIADMVDRRKEDKDAQNEILVAICGSGHCEYDFGMTERVRQCSRADMLLLVAKPDDGGYWTDESEHSGTGRALADAIVVFEAVDV